jgi:hypothetical protein
LLPARAAVADLDHQRVDVQDRVEAVQRPGLPRGDLLSHHVGHPRDQRRGDLGAVDLGQVRLDVAGGHAARVQREDHVIDLPGPPPPLRDDDRLEGGVTVAGHIDADRPGRGRDGLLVAAVTRVPGPVPGRIALHVTQVIIELGAQRPLQHRPGDLAQQPARAVDRHPGRLGVAQHPVDRLRADQLRQPLLRRQRLQRRPGQQGFLLLIHLAGARAVLDIRHGVYPFYRRTLSHTGVSGPPLTQKIEHARAGSRDGLQPGTRLWQGRKHGRFLLVMRDVW